MTILITGATGFVISNLTRHLAELGQDVVAADLNPPDDALRDFLSGLPGQVSFRQVDVADPEAVHGLVRELRPARAVHGAAITAIPPEVERARFFGEVNDLDLGVARLASPFGRFERDPGSRPLLSAIRTWALAGLRGQPIRLSGPPEAPRDVVYAADVASGIAAVLLADRLPHRVYNVGWGRAATADEILAGLAKLIPGFAVERQPQEASPWSGGPNGTRGPL